MKLTSVSGLGLGLGLGLAITVLAGCTRSHLPRGAQFVGGGLKIDYEAPRSGTAILLERNSQRIVATESLSSGADFEFYPGVEGYEEVLLTMFGEHLTLPEGSAVRLKTNTFFELYFVPDRTPNE